MTHSENLSNLASALSALQAEVNNPKNTAVNPFLKNKYAPLNDILTEVRPLLAKHGLSVAQLPTGADTVGVTTMLLHKSGEWISDSVSMTLHGEKGKSDAQVAGSIITYFRRYAISSVLGIASEDDTDANQPTKPRQSDEKGPQSEDGAKDVPNAKAKEWNALVKRMTDAAQSIPEEKREAFRKEYGLIKDAHDVAELTSLVNRMEEAATDAEVEQI